MRTKADLRLDVAPDGRPCFVRRFAVEAARSLAELRRMLDEARQAPPPIGYERTSWSRTENVHTLSGEVVTVDVEMPRPKEA